VTSTHLVLPSPTLARLTNAMLRLGLLPLMLLAFVAVALIEPRFLGAYNILNNIRTGSVLAIVACGQALVLILGEFDLSVGAVMALSSVTAAFVMRAVTPLAPGGAGLVIACGVGGGLLAAAAVGLANGVCVAVLRLSGFIVTLGMMSVVSGTVLSVTNGAPVYGLPDILIKGFGRALWGGLPTLIYVAVALIALLWFLQRRTVFGRHSYAVGGNLRAAEVSGVASKKIIIVNYVLCSLLAGAAGLLLTIQIGSGQASLGGENMTLQSIAAAVVGGVSLRGGVGRVDMVAVGAFFLTLLANALNLIRVNSKFQLIFVGLIVILAVACDQVFTSRTSNE
jgi:ribose transport system permease protein